MQLLEGDHGDGCQELATCSTSLESARCNASLRVQGITRQGIAVSLYQLYSCA